MSNAALIQLIEGMADNKYVLGDRLAKIGFSGPDVESTLASIAMAQGELGHARLLYNWVFDLKGHTGKKPDIKEETGKSFPAVRAVDGWISLIANFYLVNLSLDIVMDSMALSRHQDVKEHINKLYLEHKEHCVYSESWARKLKNDQGSIPRRFEKAINQVFPEVQQWLKSIENTPELNDYLAFKDLPARFQAEVNHLLGKGAAAHVG